MTDVWRELGRALGRALRPLADMAENIWRAFGDSTGDLVRGLMGGAQDLKATVEPTITNLLPTVFDEAALALGEDSPPEEIKTAVDKFIKELMAKIEKESKTEGKSLPTPAQLATRQAGLVSIIMGMYAATHAVSIALDATHPLKDWGFKSAIMDMLYQFNMREVIGPMIQAPIWASIVTPMRMRARANNPYDIPGSGVLPYMLAKGMITDEEYHLNMSYHALDETWSDRMLENVYRYPGFGELRTMIHRDVATIEEAQAVLSKSMIHEDYIDRFTALVPSIPGFGDLRRYAVREAFPDANTFLEHFEKMKYWMGQQGYSEYFAQADWDAHWIIITAGQADTLLHRGMITEEQHTALYILNDIKPEHIDDLRALTWSLPGKIEARWMFRWGEIDVTGLRDLLINAGLDPTYADQVAAAMAKNQFLSDINRQIANIKSDFTRGYSVEATLRGDLAALGQRSEIVEYHVVDALADRERSMRDEALRTLRAQYARGAKTLDDVVDAARAIIVDTEAWDAWVAALPTAKQVIIMEETFTTEVNRLVANAKYDYIRGYTLRGELVAELQRLGFTDEVVDLHVRDAEGDRDRKRNDERLVVIKDMWIKDVEPDFDVITGWAAEIIRESEALDLWLDDTYFDKMRTTRIPEVEPKVPAVSVSVLKTAFRSGIITEVELTSELTTRAYTPEDINLIIAVELAKIKPDKIPALPLSTLKRALRDQITTEANFRAALIAREYSPEDIDIMVEIELKAIEEGLIVLPETPKLASLGTLRTALREGIIDVDAITSELTDRGYELHTIELILAVEASRIKPEKMIVMPLSTLKTAFRDQIIDEPHFRVQLDARGYSPEDIDVMVAVELKAIEEGLAVLPEEPKLASLGTLRTALREGIIDVDEFTGELDARGYGDQAIELIIAVEATRIKPEKIPMLPLSTLKRAFRDQILDESRLRAELEARGHTQANINIMVAVEVKTLEAELAVMPEEVKTVSLGTLRMAFRLGVITEKAIRDELAARDYGPEAVDLLVAVDVARMEE